mmetsp:Transcript_6755/g.20462  ORF Transcript_6755/g.20462 Transcript_6755/m.20462 type:complete len:143 (+) Transcript_6755:405-833(+)|eukprot:scaffold20042_cov32-Tisochrysis_lutea.AAC.2
MTSSCIRNIGSAHDFSLSGAPKLTFFVICLGDGWAPALGEESTSSRYRNGVVKVSMSLSTTLVCQDAAGFPPCSTARGVVLSLRALTSPTGAELDPGTATGVVVIPAAGAMLQAVPRGERAARKAPAAGAGAGMLPLADPPT